MDSATAQSKKRRFQQYLAECRPASIGEAEWNALAALLAPVSESYLRELVRRTGLPFEQPWAGVRQKNFQELEASLLELREVYAAAMAAGRRDHARYARRQVISAKDHARFASRNPRSSPETRARKEEMVEWMLVWLGDPEMFPEWARLRKRVLLH